MTRFTRPALLIGLALTASSISQIVSAATAEERIMARLNALEQENAGLRKRLNRLEASPVSKPSAPVAVSAAQASMPPRQAEPFYAKTPVGPVRWSPTFEVSGTLVFLQSAAGNMEYGTLTNPLPAVSPHWNNQSLAPGFDPAFEIGARYIVGANDFALRWTYLDTTTNNSFEATPDQMVGPPYLIGPESGLYKRGRGTVNSKFELGEARCRPHLLPGLRFPAARLRRRRSCPDRSDPDRHLGEPRPAGVDLLHQQFALHRRRSADRREGPIRARQFRLRRRSRRRSL